MTTNGKWIDKLIPGYSPNINWIEPNNYDYYLIGLYYDCDWNDNESYQAKVYFFNENEINILENTINNGKGLFKRRSQHNDWHVSNADLNFSWSSKFRIIETNSPKLYSDLYSKSLNTLEHKEWFEKQINFSGDLSKINFEIPKAINNVIEIVESNENKTEGQFGGTGKLLEDIKLSLFSKKITRGELKITNPQVELGTVPTDWKPNSFDNKTSVEVPADIKVGGYNYILNSNKSFTSNENAYKKYNFELEKGLDTIKHLQGKDIILSFDIDGEANFTEAGLEFKYQSKDGTMKNINCKAKVETQNQGKNRLIAKFTLQ